MPFRGFKPAFTILVGPLATASTALAVEVVSHYVYRIPAPGAFMLLMVAAGTYVGGFASGYLSAAMVTFYLSYVTVSGSAAFTAGDALPRVIVFTTTAFAMATLVGMLRRRTTVAEERRLHAVMQLSDRRFSLLFDASPVGIVISRDTDILHANPAFFEAFEYTPDEMLGKSFGLLVAPQCRDEVVNRARQRERGEKVSAAYETIGLRKDGSEFPYLVNVARLDLSDGPATLAFITDITDQRNAEHAMLQLSRDTEFSLSSARVGSWQLDLQTKALSCSPILVATFGRREDQPFTFEDFLESLHQEDRPRVERAIQQSIDTRNAYDVEYRVVWPDNSIHWIVARGRCTYDGDGTPLIMAGITLDVTERHQAAEQLKLSQERLSLAIDGAGLGTWYRDLPADRMVWNDKCKEHFGFDKGDVITPATFFARIHPEDLDRTRQAIESAIANRSVYDVDYRTLLPNGVQRWIRATGRCTYNANGKPTRFDGITIDLTEIKQFEQELMRARRAAEAGSAAKDHFLAVLSHELRTPLTPVLASVQLLEANPELSQDIRESLEVIRRNVQLEARLIDDLLDLTRIAKGKLRLEIGTVDAHELLRQAIAICAGELNRKGIELQIELVATRHHVLADPARLQQVYWNLINNAVKFTPAGGRITARSRDHEDGTHLAVDVCDTGIGIEPQMLPRLFQPFEQADETYTHRFGGLGLGLTISKSIVDMHGGRLAAASEGRGKGATFTVAFRTVAAPVIPAAAPPSARGPASDERLNILLVDDHEDTNRAMRRLLQQLGYRVQCAFSVKSALEAANSDAFDLLISDIGLPDGSGLELMRQLLADQKNKAPKGIALSGFGMEEDVRRSLEAGFRDHLTKPVSFEKLESAIRELSSANVRG